MKKTHCNVNTSCNALIVLALLILSMSKVLAAQQHWLFKSAEVLDIVTGDILSGYDVLVENGFIVKVAKDINASHAQTIQAENDFLVPGWVEMHAHIPPNRIPQKELEDLLFLYSAHGITTVRGMLGASWHLELKQQLSGNDINGPTLITSGPSFNGQSVNGPTYAQGRVKAQFEKGYDFIKVHPGMSNEEYRAMANTARSLGLDFSGHVTADTGLLQSAHLGQGTIDHLDGVITELAKRSGAKNLTNRGFFGSEIVDKVDPSQIPKLAKELANSGIALVPTESLMIGFVSPVNAQKEAKKPHYQLMPKTIVYRWIAARDSIHNNPGYSPEKAQLFFDLRKAFIKAFHHAGGTVLIGSDAPQVFNVPGDAIHHEMEIMVASGLTALEVLQSASLKPAEFFKQQNNGKIKQGYQANMVLLKQNPLQNITTTRNIAGVMTRGQWLDEKTIASRIETIKNTHK